MQIHAFLTSALECLVLLVRSFLVFFAQGHKNFKIHLNRGWRKSSQCKYPIRLFCSCCHRRAGGGGKEKLSCLVWFPVSSNFHAMAQANLTPQDILFRSTILTSSPLEEPFLQVTTLTLILRVFTSSEFNMSRPIRQSAIHKTSKAQEA
jgi:hypothetical protein